MISVIIPVYNVEKYLCECIDSILNQTYKEYEIILVDDGSSDKSGLICDWYAKRDSRIKVIHKENRGLASARNAGIQIAKGDFISFIDSDDWVKPNMLEVLFEAICLSDADMAICSIQKEQDTKDISRDTQYFWVEDKFLNQVEMLQRQTGENAWIYVGACNKLYRRWLFQDISFPEGYIFEDAAIWHRLLGKCSSFICVSEALYIYRVRMGSILNSAFSIQKTDHLSAWADRICFTHERRWTEWEHATIIMYVEAFFEYYFRFENNQENRVYIDRMEQSLHKSLPCILRCNDVKNKQKMYLTLIYVHPRLFWLFRSLYKRIRKFMNLHNGK